MRFNKHRLIYLVLIFFLSLSLTTVTGCGKKTSPTFSPGEDGPPTVVPKHLDRVPDAVPKVEPLSRYGNRFKNSNTYVTGKKRYKVMPTSRGYSAQGLASWYGKKFHGRKTSSGEPYDMFGMTAAHRTLPLPTYAKVTNLANGKSVIVKVNDRGPFHCDRLIDLSYVAAHKLGILGHGTGKVKIESIDPRDHHGMIPKAGKTKLAKNANHSTNNSKNTTPLSPLPLAAPLATAPLPKATKSNTTKSEPIAKEHKTIPTQRVATPTPTDQLNIQKPVLDPKPPTKITASKKIYLQLGSFKEKNNAETFAKKVGDFSKLPTSVAENMGEKGSRFRVRLGPLKNEEQVLTLKQELAKAKFPTPVVIRET